MEAAGRPLEMRVRYSETDQMGVAYHAHYLVWCEMARTDFLRQKGTRYRDLEDAGLRLAVTEVNVRYRQAAVYDDLIKVHCWVRDLTKRTIQFGYLIERADDRTRLATAVITLIALDTENKLSLIPQEVRDKLPITEDPIRL